MTTEVQPRVETQTGHDEEKFAHLVTKDDWVRGYVEGVAIQALCGTWFVPSVNPEHRPRCEPCAEVLGSIKARSQN